MTYRIGLVGKPSVGKSTLFNAATTNDVPEGAYPFTTIDPSVGEAYVRVDCPAPEFDTTCTPETGVCRDGTRYVPVKLVDVAGLVPGAHEGRGLGNQFLSDLNETDVLVHVVDFSGTTDAEGEPTEGHDPREDVAFLTEELDEWYLDILHEALDRYETAYEGADADVRTYVADQMDAFGVTEATVERVLRRADLGFDPDAWNETDERTLASRLRRRTKPIVIAANKMDTPEARENYETFLADDDHDERVVPVSAHAEKALVRAREAGVVEYHPGEDDFEVVGEVSDEQARGLEQVRSFLSEFGGTGVQRVLETALFEELGVVPVFPGAASGAASDDDRFRDCFLLPPGSTVEDFAYRIHSDLGERLLHGIDCRSDRQVGADHELDDRDVLELITTA